MTAVWRSFSHASRSGGADPPVTKPTGTVDGDLLIAVGVCSNGQTITAPGGWTKHAASVPGDQGVLWTKIASGEGADYTFTVSGLAASQIVIACIETGTFDPAAPIDDADGIQTAGGTAGIVIPSVTSGGADRLLFQIAARLNNGATHTGPISELWDTTSTNQNFGSVGANEVVGSGATGSRTWTSSSASNPGVGYMVAIKPLAPTNVDSGDVGLDETVTLTAAGATGTSKGTTSADETVTLTSAGSTGVSRGTTAQAETVTLSATGATGKSGAASALAVTATLSASGLAGVTSDADEVAETVTLSASGSTGVDSDSDETAVTVTLEAEGLGGAGSGSTTDVTVTLSAAGEQGVGGGATATATVTLTAAGSVGKSAGASLAVTATLGTSGAIAQTVEAELSLTVTLTSAGQITRPFATPVQAQSMDDHFWSRYSMPVGVSVVKVDGHFVRMPTPSQDELTAAGSEGIDWFRGGYAYEVSAEVEADLISDGFI